MTPELTKREYFAAQAMQGILANNFLLEFYLKKAVKKYKDDTLRAQFIKEEIIGFTAILADDLIKELENKK